MPAVFLYSDPHFGHQGVCHFMRADGVTKLRPWDTAEEMDEELINRYNERVRPNDKIYFLGDVVINRRAMSTLARLNGDKVLIRGNHDIFRDNEYRQYFRELRAYHVMNGLILSHIPIHEASLGRFKLNVHGHLHSNRVMKPTGFNNKTGEIVYSETEVDYRFHCVCVEQTDFAPILFEDVVKRIEEERETAGFTDARASILGPD
jgi:calcineurin-like phosphoesterase family protein